MLRTSQYGQTVHNAGGWTSAYVFNNDITDYASFGQGANTFLEFTFPGAVTFDSMVVVNRTTDSWADVISNYTLTLSSGTRSIVRSGGVAQGGFDSFASVTTTTVRLDVDTLGQGVTGAGNTGAMEIYFLKTPVGMTPIPSVSVTAASNNPFGGGYVATNAINGLIGRDFGTEFASDAGTDTFVDFSFGMVKTVTGFDFFDRMASDAKVSGFDLIFSTDDIWGNGDDVTRHYTGSTQSDEFAGISAKNVRYDVTSISGTNVGMNEIRFFEAATVPLTWKSTTDGTWDIGGPTNWNDGAGAVAFSDGRNVTFDDSASITTVNTAVAVTPGSITVNNPTKDYTLGGSAITGGTGLAKSGVGNLTLTGVNTFTGGITIHAGTLTIGGSGLLGDGSYAGNITNHGSFVYNSSATQILSGTLSGAGATTVSKGILALSAATTSAITVDASGTLNLTNPTAGFGSRATRTGDISGAGTVNINGGGASVAGGWVKLNSGGANFTSFTGTINVNSGVLTMDNLNATLTGNPTMNVVAGGVFGIRGQNVSLGALTGDGDVANDWSGDTVGHTLTLGANDDSGTFSGNIHGNSTGGEGTLEAGKLFLAKSGSGSQTLSGTNTYTGSTTINGGTLALSGTATLASTTISIASGARFDVSALAAAFTLTSGNLTAGRTSGFADDVTGNLTLDTSTLTIGGSGAVAGTLSQTGNLTLNNGIVNCDLAATSTAGGGVNDLVSVTGDITLTGFSDIVVNKLTGALSAGTYTLLSCTGNLTGTTAELNLVGLTDTARQHFALGTSANSVVLNVTGVAANLVWTGGSFANPSFWDLGVTANWSGDDARFLDGDVVTFNDTALTRTVDVQGIVQPGGVIFDNALANPYSVTGTGEIGGVTGMIKNGDGLVAITTPNTFTGTTAINNGTISVADLGGALGSGALITLGDPTHTGTLQTTATTGVNRAITLGAGGGILDVAPATTMSLSGGIFGGANLTKTGDGVLALSAANSYTGTTTVNGGVLSTNTLAPNGSNSGIGAGAALTLNGGTLRYTGGNNGNDTLATEFNRSITLGAGGGMIDIASSGFLFCNSSFTGSSALSILSTSGPGPTRMLLYTGNSPGFSGPVSIGNGTADSGWLQVRSDAASPLGSGVITINTGGILSSDYGATSPATLGNNIILNGGTLMSQSYSTSYSGTVTVTPSVTSYLSTLTTAANLVISGSLQGAGTAVKNGTNNAVELRGDNSGFTGTYNHTSGATLFYTAASTSAAASWNIPAGSATDSRLMAAASNATYQLGALSGATTGLLENLSAASGNSTFEIGALNTSTTFDGVIQDNGGTVGITKVGATGTLTLGGTNTYTGNTTVNAGTLNLASGGQLSFVLGAASGTNNSITGAGTATIDGNFAIDTAAADSLPSGTWTLVNVGTLVESFGGSFQVISGFSDAGSNKWTKPVAGSKIYTFDETTGILTLGSSANYTSWASTHGITGEAATLDHDNDGLNNGMEYALALDPTLPNGTPGTLTAGVLSFTKGADAIANGDVTYVIEESDDLGLADPWAAMVTQTPPNASATISYTLPTGKPKVFSRLKISIQ